MPSLATLRPGTVDAGRIFAGPDLTGPEIIALVMTERHLFLLNVDAGGRATLTISTPELPTTEQSEIVRITLDPQTNRVHCHRQWRSRQ